MLFLSLALLEFSLTSGIEIRKLIFFYKELSFNSAVFHVFEKSGVYLYVRFFQFFLIIFHRDIVFCTLKNINFIPNYILLTTTYIFTHGTSNEYMRLNYTFLY